MSAHLNCYTRLLKLHDSDLFCELNKQGIPCVWRKTKRFIPVIDGEGFKVSALIDHKQFVVALTHNWATHGRVVHWGMDRVLDKVRSIDGFNADLIKEVEDSEKKVEASKQRAMRNDMEAFWSDQRSRFKEATKDILTHSMDKSEPHKKLREKNRRFKDGYR